MKELFQGPFIDRLDNFEKKKKDHNHWVDKRVAKLLEMEDPDLIWDLRIQSDMAGLRSTLSSWKNASFTFKVQLKLLSMSADMMLWTVVKWLLISPVP